MLSEKLTARQIEIAIRVLEGWSNKKIAIDLNIEPHTVAVHLQSIYPKLDVHSRYELIVKYRDHENGNRL